MIVENVKTLGIAEKFYIYIAIYIYIYIYIFIYYLSNLLIFLLNNYIYHCLVSKNIIVFSMFDCL